MKLTPLDFTSVIIYDYNGHLTQSENKKLWKIRLAMSMPIGLLIQILKENRSQKIFC